MWGAICNICINMKCTYLSLKTLRYLSELLLNCEEPLGYDFISSSGQVSHLTSLSPFPIFPRSSHSFKRRVVSSITINSLVHHHQLSLLSMLSLSLSNFFTCITSIILSFLLRERTSCTTIFSSLHFWVVVSVVAVASFSLTYHRCCNCLPRVNHNQLPLLVLMFRRHSCSCCGGHSCANK